MKTNEYKVFKEKLINAEKNSPIWSAGFLFLDLTERQGKDLFLTLYSKYGSGDRVVFPNGISIKGVQNGLYSV